MKVIKVGRWKWEDGSEKLPFDELRVTV